MLSFSLLSPSLFFLSGFVFPLDMGGAGWQVYFKTVCSFFSERWYLSNSTGHSALWSVLGKVKAVFTPWDCHSSSVVPLREPLTHYGPLCLFYLLLRHVSYTISGCNKVHRQVLQNLTHQHLFILSHLEYTAPISRWKLFTGRVWKGCS